MDKQIRVLLVEDHQVTLEGLQIGLTQEPDTRVIGTASNSDAGLALAEQLKPDVIVLDLHVPGSAGPKSMVRSFCSIPGARVIIFSAESRKAYIQTVLELGVAGYLLKSESVEDVAKAIRQILSGAKPVVSKELLAENTKLTQSEEDVLKMLARGMKYQDIAERRLTSPATVRKQCEMLLFKLNLSTREKLIVWAAENGYGSLEPHFQS